MSRSSRLLDRAARVMPGGVCCPIQAFDEVGGTPPYIARGEGPYLVDEEGHRYVDLLNAFGALILGHADPMILGAVTAAVARGAVFGAPIAREVELAEAIVARIPSVEQVRLVESGVEAEVQALHLARKLTGRSGVIFPQRLGFNDLSAVEAALVRGDVAAIFTEAVSTQGGLIAPAPGYLEGLARLAREHGALFVLDERTTGFRLAAGGAQERLGLSPDLTVLGGVLGGGFPLGALGGPARLMAALRPDEGVPCGGPHGANPVAVSASLATLSQLTDEVYQQLELIGERLEGELGEAVAYHGCSLARVGSMFTLYYREQLPGCAAEIEGCDFEAFSRFYRSALDGGAYLPPSQRATAFLPAIFRESHLELAIEALAAALVATEA
ncbi:MAG: aminotransferase class III-fold pyridoxal phosphate-dependent enzyme [Deltaproteobacteria bacterium]|nr:aminotransferase class III-fold pyridoxal phosphate-dependent enzyme [Deltaproteobacteria bacterium]